MRDVMAAINHVQQVVITRRPCRVIFAGPPDFQAGNPVFGVKRHILIRAFGRGRLRHHAIRFFTVLRQWVSHTSLPTASRLTCRGGGGDCLSIWRMWAAYRAMPPVSLIMPTWATVSAQVKAFTACFLISSVGFINLVSHFDF